MTCLMFAVEVVVWAGAVVLAATVYSYFGGMR